jgi:hypothetical protein
MPTRPIGHALSVLTMAALVTGLVLSAESQARQNPKQVEKKLAQNLKKVGNQEIKGKEAENLKLAYIFMAMANHDYEGHRVKAMNQIQAAIERLDASILKNGTANQKVVALKEEIAAARAKFLAQHQAKVHEPQALSDLQMREAHRLIQNIAPGLAALKQPVVTKHVKEALRQIEIALKIR